MNPTNNSWKKSVVAVSIFISSVLTLLFLFLDSLSLTLAPLFFIGVALAIYVYLYITLKLNAKIGKRTSFVATKLVNENITKLGTIEKNGNLVYSWTLSGLKAEFAIVLHYKKIIFTSAFLILFIFCLSILHPVINSVGIVIYVLLSAIFPLAAIGFFVGVNLAASKLNVQAVSYEILSEGVNINRQLAGENMTGLFTPYSNLADPVFDDKNNFIVLRAKDKGFLRRFITCTLENYKEVSDYIKSKLLPPPLAAPAPQPQS